MMASDSVYSNHATSSRRGSSSRSESTWSRQWNEEEPGPAVVDVATQVAGYHFAKSQKKTQSCLKISGGIVLFLICIAGALVGGYYLRTLRMETTNPNNGFPYGPVTWKEAVCQKEMNHTATNSECRGVDQNPTLLVICLSGFRPDFLGQATTPTLFHLKACGVSAPFLRPVFPTNTLPNQHTIATGLYPESHGIVDDLFRDRETAKVFDGRRGVPTTTGSQFNDPAWWKGEPIWMTTKRQGKRAFLYHWAGSEVSSMKPDESVAYSTNIPLHQRFEKLTSWVTLSGSQRPALVMAFIDEPSAIAKRTGTKSQEFTETMRNIDNELDKLMENMHRKGLLSCTNVLLVSDHGVEDSTCPTTIATVTDPTAILLRNLQKDYNMNVSPNSPDAFLRGGHARIPLLQQSQTIQNFNNNNPLQSSLQPYMVYNSLACNHTDNAHVAAAYTLYNTGNIPRRLHFSDAARIEPYLLTAKPGHLLARNTGTSGCERVTHGSDNRQPNLNGIFLAVGPSFRAATEVDSFATVELYNLMCHVTGLTPAENNGTRGGLNSVLVAPERLTVTSGSPASIRERKLFPATERVMKESQQEHRCAETCRDERLIDGLTESDLRLNISDTLAENLARAISAPYGLPGAPETLQIAPLVNHGFIAGYSAKLRLTLWAMVSVSSPNPKISISDQSLIVDCQRNDVRFSIGSALTCADLRSTPRPGDPFPMMDKGYLIPPVLTGDPSDQTDALIITNVMPMYASFRKDIWAVAWDKLASAMGANGGMITAGPVFDHEPQFGHADSADNLTHVPGLQSLVVPQPSHFFLIAIRHPTKSLCNKDNFPSKDCRPDALAFILPHKSDEKQHPCHVSVDDYLATHTATVKDVSRTTGLSFLLDLPVTDAVRLHVSLPPAKLWWLT